MGINIFNKAAEKKLVINVNITDENAVWKVVNVVEDHYIESIRKAVDKINEFEDHMNGCENDPDNDPSVKRAVQMNAWVLHNQLKCEDLAKSLNEICTTMEKLRGWRH